MAEDLGNNMTPSAEERAELRRMIDALMAQPPKEWPSIIVVGDDTVSAIYAPKSQD
jgi:hypothetical protein